MNTLLHKTLSLSCLSKIFLLSLLLYSNISVAQYIEVDDSYTAQALVEDVFIGLENQDCVEISNVVISGYTFEDAHLSYGYFNKGTSNFPIEEGIILTTGKAVAAIGPNENIISDGPAGGLWGGDQDLEQAIGLGNTTNATIIEFDFVANFSTVSFDYIFASEQYLTSIVSPAQCNYTDGFAFLIKRTNVNEPFTNLAVVPGTDIPVTVNTVRGEGVCPSANEEYFGGFSPNEHPTNYNGQTKVLTAQTEIIAGESYRIKLVIADQGNNLYDSAVFLKGGSFGNAKKDLGPDRLIASGNPLCEGETFIADATTDQAFSYQWFLNENPIIGETNPVYEITQDGYYQVEIEFADGSCLMTGELTIEYSQNPIVQNSTLVQCEASDTSMIFNLTLSENQIVDSNENLTFRFFESFDDAQTNQNPISNPENYTANSVNQLLYVQVTNPFGCYAIAELTLSVTNTGLSNPTDLESCENIFDLTSNQQEIIDQIPQNMTLDYYESFDDALLENNPITNLNAYQTNTNTTVYVKISENGNCFGIVWFDLILRTIDVDTSDVELILCEDGTLNIAAPDGYTSYIWNNGETTSSIEIDQIGSYTVTISNEFGCEATKTYIVSSSAKPRILSVVIDDMNSSSNTVLINVEGSGNYEYSLNGIEFQQSNFFSNVSSGQHLVFVRDLNGCGEATQLIFVLEYPKFFTPNGDGINDQWRIPMLMNQYPNTFIEIFDRYGKLIYGFSAQQTGWDGTYNSEKLPATDYWFVVKLPERTVRGHFSLVR